MRVGRPASVCLAHPHDLAAMEAQVAHDDALRADAERLAELREERRRWESKLMGALRLAKLDAIIAVYEELAARGLTFGGGR